jgi:hypothetical protein
MKNNWFNSSPIPNMISEVNQANLNIEYHPLEFNKIAQNFMLKYPQIGDTIDNTILRKEIVAQCRILLESK